MSINFDSFPYIDLTTEDTHDWHDFFPGITDQSPPIPSAEDIFHPSDPKISEYIDSSQFFSSRSPMPVLPYQEEAGGPTRVRVKFPPAFIKKESGSPTFNDESNKSEESDRSKRKRKFEKLQSEPLPQQELRSKKSRPAKVKRERKPEVKEEKVVSGLFSISEEEELKAAQSDPRKLRTIRNRFSARRSRAEKKANVAELEERVESLHTDIFETKKEIAGLQARNKIVANEIAWEIELLKQTLPRMYPDFNISTLSQNPHTATVQIYKLFRERSAQPPAEEGEKKS